MKRLDEKLARIQAGTYQPTDFIIADAKDADMSFGSATPGPEVNEGGQPTGRMKPLQAYRDDMLRVIESDLVDIMLTSVSGAEYLTGLDALGSSPITQAIRVNDSSDIWNPRGANYKTGPAAPFRTARLDRVAALCDLGLYAISFYNDLATDLHTLERYAQFRDDAATAGIRHFLEVFNPLYPVDTPGADFADYNNDAITRCLAGVARADRPIFLKVVYNGPRSTEALASFDPGNLIVGILGGAAGTTRDTLELVQQGEKYGARVALFGRKVYFAESSVEILRAMRLVIEENVTSEEATRSYHDALAKQGIRPKRPLEDDLQITEPIVRAGMA